MRGNPPFGMERVGGVVAPSLLSADFTRLGDEIQRVTDAGARMLHLDVMDGHFVQNITFGPPLVAAIRECTDLYLDCHLMVEEPLRYVEAFAQAGADLITIHAELFQDVRPPLARLRSLGIQAGISLNPETPLSRVNGMLGACDLVLLMSVFPGFGGQKFHPGTLDKIAEARDVRRAHGDRFAIEVDGGIGAGNAEMLVRQGADVLVAGSAIFAEPDPGAAFCAIRAAAARAAG